MIFDITGSSPRAFGSPADAIKSIIFGRGGGEVIASRTLDRSLGLAELCSSLGLSLITTDMDHPCGARDAISPRTAAVIGDILGGPSLSIPPIETIAGVASRARVPFILDISLAAGAFDPFYWGADAALISRPDVGETIIASRGHEIDGEIPIEESTRALERIAREMPDLCRETEALARELETSVFFGRVLHASSPSHPQADFARQFFGDTPPPVITLRPRDEADLRAFSEAVGAKDLGGALRLTPKLGESRSIAAMLKTSGAPRPRKHIYQLAPRG